MATSIRVNQPFVFNWQYRIADADIEIKEKQFINQQVDYYKAIKSKPKKKSFFEDVKPKSLRSWTSKD